MISVTILKDTTNSVLQRLLAITQRNVTAAATHFAAQAKRTVGVSAGGASKRAKHIRKDPTHSKHEKYRHSKPGEPPRKITGNLQSNIVVEVRVFDTSVVATVGVRSQAKYGVWLDQGTDDGRIAPRPWIQPTYEREQATLHAMLSEGLQ